MSSQVVFLFILVCLLMVELSWRRPPLGFAIGLVSLLLSLMHHVTGWP